MAKATATAGHGQAIIYCRVSDKGQEVHGTSLDSQEREGVAHAAAVVRRIFTLVAEERRSYYSIGRLLSAEGVPAPGAARFPDRSVLWKADTIMRFIARAARRPLPSGRGRHGRCPSYWVLYPL